MTLYRPFPSPDLDVYLGIFSIFVLVREGMSKAVD